MTTLKYRIHKELRSCRCRDGDEETTNPDKTIDKNILNVRIVGATKEQMERMEKDFVTIIQMVGCTSEEVLRWK